MKISSRLSKFFSQHANLLLSLIICVFLGAIFFFLRQVFFYRYEPEYYENYYYFSQWNIPSSTRGISDGELYKFVGYRLVEGENPFYLNFEIPPLGKYLYGLAEKTIGNPYWVSISFYLASLVVFYFLLRDFFKEKYLSLIGLLLFVTTPFVATQIRETMLDLPLMFFYLLHVFLFLRFLKEKTNRNKLVYLLLAGASLGLATGVKPGIYTPLVGLLGAVMIFLLQKKDKIKSVIFYTGSVIAGYVAAYFCYFIRHPNPIPWIRLHQKPLEFYLSPQNNIDYFNQWRSIFANTYQGWWQPGRFTTVGDWTLVLPLGVVAILLILFFSFKKKDYRWTYVSLVSLSFLLINTFVPFWSRYLMPLIPLFVVSLVYLFRQKKFILYLLILANLPFLYSSIVPNKVDGHTHAIARFTSTRAYRELYRSLDFEQRKNLNEVDFIRLNEDFYQVLGTRKISTEVIKLEKISSRHARATYLIEYLTDYGPLEHQLEADFYRRHNQWKMVWNWDMLWPGYSPETQVVVGQVDLPLKQLKNSSGQVYATPGTGYVVSMIPRLMFDWNQSLNQLAYLTGKSSMFVDSKIKEVIPDDFPRFIGLLDQSLGQEGIEQAQQTKGVILRQVLYPLVIQGLPQSDQAIQHLRLLEETQPELFYLQADVYLQDNQGKRTLLPFPDISPVILTF